MLRNSNSSIFDEKELLKGLVVSRDKFALLEDLFLIKRKYAIYLLGAKAVLIGLLNFINVLLVGFTNYMLKIIIENIGRNSKDDCFRLRNNSLHSWRILY